METNYYLTQFQQAADRLDKATIAKKHFLVETGIWLNSVVLRLQKPHWVNEPFKRPQSGPAIFFSVWVKNDGLKQQKLFYNIHALKLRQLKGYKLTSREFASAFREKFIPHKKDWPNVRVDYGPLTLMEGWINPDPENITNDVFGLANKFLRIDFLIDDLLAKYKQH